MPLRTSAPHCLQRSGQQGTQGTRVQTGTHTGTLSRALFPSVCRGLAGQRKHSSVHGGPGVGLSSGSSSGRKPTSPSCRGPPASGPPVSYK